MPGRTGMLRPHTPSRARASRFGVRADSSSVLPPARLKELAPRLQQVRSQIAAERDLPQAPPELQPLHTGFIDLPQKTLDQHRRQGEASVLGRVLARATQLKAEADRVVVLGIGG